jgi:hypothetical protein
MKILEDRLEDRYLSFHLSVFILYPLSFRLLSFPSFLLLPPIGMAQLIEALFTAL